MSKDFIPAAKLIIGMEERTAVDDVLQSGILTQGSEVTAFKTELVDMFAAGRETVTINSGTSALLCGLLATSVGVDGGVTVSSFTFAATTSSMALTKVTLVLADIEPEHFCLDPQAVAAAVTERIKAILPVHLYGHPANMTALGEITRENGPAIFEDAAQAHGTTWSEQPVGIFGAFGAFSLYPTKDMTSGEGGMITCETPELARECCLYHNQGMEKQYKNEIVRYNLRMMNIHAVIGREQLKELADWTARHRENAALLSANLQGVKVPAIIPETTHMFHQYTIHVVDDCDGFVKVLREEYQVDSGIYYPTPNRRLSPLVRFAPGLDLPATEATACEVASLLAHPSSDSEDLERIVTATNALAGSGAQFRFFTGS